MTSRLKRRFIIKGPLFSSFLNNKSELSFPVSSSQRVSCQKTCCFTDDTFGCEEPLAQPDAATLACTAG